VPFLAGVRAVSRLGQETAADNLLSVPRVPASDSMGGGCKDRAGLRDLLVRKAKCPMGKKSGRTRGTL